MRCTSGWRTTSSLLNAVNAIPRTSASIFWTATMPLFCPRARSICVMSPVTTAFEPKPMRVRNIFICSGVVFWASSRMTNEWFRERPQVRIDLLSEVAGQEPQALARLDCGPHQHDALHGIALQRVHRARHREIGLAGPRGTDREGDVVLEDVLDVVPLPGRAAAQVRPPREQGRVLLRAAAGADFDQAELNVVQGETAFGVVVEFLQHVCRLGGMRSADGETLAAARDRDVQRGLDLPEVLVQRPAQIGEALVVDRREDEFQRTGLQRPTPQRGPRRAASEPSPQ